MASLRRLLARSDAIFLPGHGPAIADPRSHTEALLAHRLAREEGVLGALRGGAGTPATIVPILYPGLADALERAAERSVLAHLLKLAAEGRAVRDQLPGGGESFRAAT